MGKVGFSALSQIGQISLRVRDLERAVAFYQTKLGMRFLFQVPTMAFFDCDGVRLLLSLPEGAEDNPPGSILYFNAPDLHAWTEALKARGVEFSGEPALVAKMPDHDLWMSFFQDTEGNTLALMSEVRPTGE